MAEARAKRSSVTIRRRHSYEERNKTRGRKYFILRPHQGKEKAYVDALKKRGYYSTIQSRIGVKFALYDMDGGRRREVLEAYQRRKLPLFLYPHAARPMIIWDGIWEPWPFVRCNFVIGPGHKEVMERYGYDNPIEVCGWTYCDLVPFEPVKKDGPLKILFGPIHPSVSGWVAKEDKEANRQTFSVLREYCHGTGAQLTVRYIKKLKMNGLDEVRGVNYVQGVTNQSIAEIDQADIVVGHQTFAYLALARGKPVIMMREDLPPHTVSHGQTVYAASWEKYADMMAYPLDILAGDPGGVIERASQGCAEVEAWKDRFINVPWDAEKFISKLESYL